MPGEQCRDPVPSESDAAVGRSSVCEGVQQESELLLRFLRTDAHDLEDEFLDLAPVDTYRSATDLVAVADDVVGVRQRGSGVGFEHPERFGLRRGEGVVHSGPCARADGHVTAGGGIVGRLEQWRVHHPRERPVAVLDQAETLGDLAARCTEQCALCLGGPGGEEHTVAGGRADVGDQTGPLVLGQVLGHRPTERTVFLDKHIRQPFGAALLRPLLPGVELSPWLACPARHDNRTHVGSLEHPERSVLEVVGALHQLESESQVRFVAAEPAHRLGVGDPRDRRREVIADQLPQRDEDLFCDCDHVVLLDEAHLDVELGELGLAVGAEILVAVAAGDLEVPLHPGDHQQLLEELGTLGQRIEGAGLQPCRHQKVAGAFGGGSGQRRGLDLDEVLIEQNIACGVVHFRTEPQGRARAFAAEIEIPVLQTGFLAGALVELERQWRGFVEHNEFGRIDLDRARLQVRVLTALGSLLDESGDLHAIFCAEPVRRRGHRLVAENHLCEPGAVAQVDEDDPAMVAASRHPTGQRHGLSGVLGP